MNIPLSGCLLSVQRLGLYWPEPERRRPTRREGRSAMTSGKGLGKQNFETPVACRGAAGEVRQPRMARVAVAKSVAPYLSPI